MSGWEWTEYDSCGAGYQPAEPYGDFTVALDGSNDPVVTNVTRYIGGFGGGAIAQQTVSGGATTYKHGDLIGSVQLATDGSGAADSSPATLAYTAFGEHVTAGSGSAANVGWPVTTGSIGATRYHYAGAHGYESGLLSLSGANSTLAPITLQHLGARWYQPGIGRFVQRDPIGIDGGINMYAYCSNSPTEAVDPEGLSDKGRGDDPRYWLSEEQLEELLRIARGKGREGRKEAQQIIRIQKHRGFRNKIKRGFRPPPGTAFILGLADAYDMGQAAGESFNEYTDSLRGQPGPTTVRAGQWRCLLSE